MIGLLLDWWVTGDWSVIRWVTGDCNRYKEEVTLGICIPVIMVEGVYGVTVDCVVVR